MAQFVIQGGNPVSGRHKAPGNKNAALPMLAACLLTDEPVRLRNVPLIDDVYTMLEILADLGVQTECRGHSITLCAGGIRRRRLNASLCHKVRSSILFAGPLVARYGQARIFPPGGDVIGRRRLDTHFEGLHRLGIETCGTRDYRFSCDRLHGADVLLDEASVTATENILMAAVLAEGRTTLFNAACEPHVQDLCRMLNRMGARVRGIGTNRLEIDGVTALKGVSHRVGSDTTDVVSYAVAALVTGGALEITHVAENDLRIIDRSFRKLNVRWSVKDGVLRIPADQKLAVQNDFGAAIPKVDDGPWPNFPSDLMSVAIVLATQARGTILFFEKMFESRMFFVDRLIEMGARIVQCDPHRVIVSGPARLNGTPMSSPDIRAGVALVLAALCAKGESVIGNAQVVDRGYEGVAAELRRLGADIRRVDG